MSNRPVQPSRPTAHSPARRRPPPPPSPAPKLLKILPRERQTGAKTKLAANPAAANAKKRAKPPSAARLPPFPSQICLISARSLGSSTHLRRRTRLPHTKPTFLRETIRQGEERGKRSHGRCQLGNAGRRVAHPGAPVDGLRRRRAGSRRPGPRPQVHRHGQPVQVSSHLLPSLAALDLVSLLVFVPWAADLFCS